MASSSAAGAPTVGVIMGSRSDWETMKAAADILLQFGVTHECRVVSAHRTPAWMVEYARAAEARNLQVIIAGAGGAAHLPGMVASMTTVPVIGVPVQSKALSGLDSLLSIVQMPGGVPVATMAIGAAGATNAGLFAVSLLATRDPELRARLQAWRDARAEAVRAETLE
jgi:5-(carboxyamino)imidazole ribonucleotide mutase